MKKAIRHKAAVVAALAIAALPFGASAAEHGDHGARHHGKAAPGALVEEMRALDQVFREVVSAVALGDGHRVHLSLEGMHGRMEKTQEALHAGDIRLRKNADKAPEFERMDKAFHADLEKLAKAAHNGDKVGMAAVTKRLLDGCVACHEKFRP